MRLLTYTSLALLLVLVFDPRSSVRAKDFDTSNLKPNEPAAPGSIYGRKGAMREKLLREGGATAQSEAAVLRGLQWLARHQHADGRWSMDDPRFPEKGTRNDTAGTAFGLLPFLGHGCTQQEAKGNPFPGTVAKGLGYLRATQDVQGTWPGGMYAHALATIALCEAYGLSKDNGLKGPAQRALDFIIKAQHEAGGWRYAPGQPGDTSVTGWHVMALKTGVMAGLDVPEATLRKATLYLDGVCNAQDEGYGYTGPMSTPTMSATGLLCRMYVQSWTPRNVRLSKGVENHIVKRPLPKNIYHNYHAAQVMHHFGGNAWKIWNEKTREQLVAGQQKDGDMSGSWSAAGDIYNQGRLMSTSLAILTLEVYYRHVPLNVP